MNNEKIESVLIRYAQDTAAEELTPHDGDIHQFHSIVQKLSQLACLPGTVHIDRLAAYQYRIDPPTSPAIKLEDLIRDDTAVALAPIASEIISTFVDIETSQVDIHKALQKVCYALWPLYSRHSLTNMIGFDLQEYADFFEDMPREDRKQLARKIVCDYWGLEINLEKDKT